MDFTKENEDDDGEEAGGKDEYFFIEGSSCSESEEELKFSHQKRSRGGSPPLLLAFSITSRPNPASSSGFQEENSDLHIEDWMILGGEEQEGDSNIQLNLSYRNNISDDESGDEG